MNTQNVTIPLNENQSLKGIILSDENFAGKRPAILVIHGWTSAMDRYPSRFKAMVDMGYLVVLFDMRGHGITGGDLEKLTIEDHFNDCLAAYDFMVALPSVDLNNISVFGSSYGGYLASILSSKRKVDHLVLNVPAQYPDETFKKFNIQEQELNAQYRESNHSTSDNRALKAISEFKGDLLIIQAENDEVIPKIVIDDYRKSATVNYTHKIIKNSDHSMTVPGANEERIKVMKQWFEQFVIAV